MIVRTENLRKNFRGSTDALCGLNLAVPEGSVFALIGPNGAGKTTTLKILLNILEPTFGRAEVLGADTRKLSFHEFTRIGYVSENQELPKRLSVGHYLNYLRPFYPDWDRQLEAEVLRQLRLPLDRKIGALSHGMRMKMSLACALPYRPKLLVLDEPFSGLDPLVRDEFMDGLIAQSGDMTVLISSHELSEIENLVTHVAFLDQGRLLFQESMDELSGRLREVRVTFDRESNASIDTPPEWLEVRTTGNVLSFVDTRFEASSLNGRLEARLKNIRSIDVQPVSLRSIFTTIARATQSTGVQE
jgi:ABC-2 type transport system ATP-binding protein